jgi:hypothetical protein
MKKLILLGLLLVGTELLHGAGSIEFKAYTPATISLIERPAMAMASVYYYDVFFDTGLFTALDGQNTPLQTPFKFTIKIDALSKAAGDKYHICKIYSNRIEIWTYKDKEKRTLSRIALATNRGVYKQSFDESDLAGLIGAINQNPTQADVYKYTITASSPECIRIGTTAYAGIPYTW